MIFGIEGINMENISINNNRDLFGIKIEKYMYFHGGSTGSSGSSLEESRTFELDDIAKGTSVPYIYLENIENDVISLHYYDINNFIHNEKLTRDHTIFNFLYDASYDAEVEITVTAIYKK